MGQNTKQNKNAASPADLRTIACKMPCLSRMCSQLGVQMGTPEQDTPGQPQHTDGESAEGQTQVCGVRAPTAVEVPGPPSASTPSLPPGGPQLPASVPTSGGKMPIVPLCVTTVLEPFSVPGLVPCDEADS